MAKFLHPSDSITIAGHRIEGGLIYVGNALRAVDGQLIDPCLIVPDLPVARGMADIRGQLMGYFPAYSTIKPPCRLAYLQWLASGRRNGAYDVGYAFLFLYGLERALLVDRLVEHRTEIRAEILRLMQLYCANNSFRMYASQLLDYDDIEAADNPPPVTQMRSAAGMELVIGWRMAHGIVPSQSDLLRLALGRERSGGKIIDQAWEEFFEAHREAANKLPVPSTAWRGATSCFVKGASQSHQALRLEKLPAGRLTVPDSTEAPMVALQTLVKAGIKRFKPYLEAIEIDPDARGTDEALMLIMSGTAALDPKAVAKRILPWSEDEFPAPLGELKSDLPKLFPGKIDIRSMADAERLLAPHGLYFSPSAVMGDLKRADTETKVRVLAATGAPDVTVPKTWPTIRVLIALARHLIPAADLAAHRAAIAANLQAMFPSLPAHAAIMIEPTLSANAPGDQGPWRDLKLIPADGRRSAALLASSIVVMTGRSDDQTARAALEKTYKAFKQEPQQLWTDLHELGFGGSPRSGGTGLDFARALEIARQSERASAVLEEIFSANEEPAAASPKPASGATPDQKRGGEGSAFEGLSVRYRPIAAKIASASSLSRSEFDEIARSLGLMPDGVIDALNEWAYDRFDRPAIEENGTNIHIDMDCFLDRAA